jgi:hypothetical protein
MRFPAVGGTGMAVGKDIRVVVIADNDSTVWTTTGTPHHIRTGAWLHATRYKGVATIIVKLKGALSKPIIHWIVSPTPNIATREVRGRSWVFVDKNPFL